MSEIPDQIEMQPLPCLAANLDRDFDVGDKSGIGYGLAGVAEGIRAFCHAGKERATSWAAAVEPREHQHPAADANVPVADENGRFAWPLPSTIALPGLNLWRSLRNAAGGGLWAGDTMTVIGDYFFDPLYADSLRITALSAEIDDFDDRMSGRGSDFV